MRLMSSLPAAPLPTDPAPLSRSLASLLALVSCLNHPPVGPSGDYCFVAAMAVPLCVFSTLFFLLPTQVLRFTTPATLSLPFRSECYAIATRRIVARAACLLRKALHAWVLILWTP